MKVKDPVCGMTIDEKDALERRVSELQFGVRHRERPEASGGEDIAPVALLNESLRRPAFRN